MSAQDPIGSSATAERPTNPTHFGGAGLYDPQAGSSADGESSDRPDGEDASANAPHSQQRSADAFWEFAKRRHVPAVLAVGGLVLLLVALVRRSTERW